jgi:hypothetical protein
MMRSRVALRLPAVVEGDIDAVRVLLQRGHRGPPPDRDGRRPLEEGEELGAVDHHHRTDAVGEHLHVDGLHRPAGAVGHAVGAHHLAGPEEVVVQAEPVQHAAAEGVQPDGVAPGPVGVALDDEDVAPLLGQAPGQGQARNASADDEHAHHPIVATAARRVSEQPRARPAPPPGGPGR